MAKTQEEMWADIREELARNKNATLQRIPNKDKKRMYKEFYKKAADQGDPFFNQNRGRYYEVSAGIMLGEIQSIQDLAKFNISDNLPHGALGEDVMSKGGVAFQIKANRSEFKIGKEAIKRIIRPQIKKNGRVSFSLTRAEIGEIIDIYHSQASVFRYGLFWNFKYLDTMIDVGRTTFRDFIVENGGLSLEKKGQVKANAIRKNFKSLETVQDYIDELVKIKKELQGGRTGEELLQEINLTGRTIEDAVKTIDEWLVDLYAEQFYLRFSFQSEGKKGGPAKLVRNYGAIIRTSIEQGEDLTGFYSILGLFGLTIKDYLHHTGRDNYQNKMAVNYYNFNYPAINY